MWEIIKNSFAWLAGVLRPDLSLIGSLQSEIDRLHKYYTGLIQSNSQRIDQCEKECAECEMDRRKLWMEVDRLNMLLIQAEGTKLHCSVTCDTHGDIIEANTAAGALTGYAVEELTRMNIMRIIPPRYRETHLTRFREVVRGMRPLRAEPLNAELLTKSGREVPVVISLVSWPTDDTGETRVYNATFKVR